MDLLMTVCLVDLFVSLTAVVWMARTDKQKSSYQQDFRLVLLALCPLNLLLFVLIVGHILQGRF